MPIGLSDSLTTQFDAMTLDELGRHHRELLLRIRDVDHWLRLIDARLDLAVAAVADLPEPGPEAAPLVSALAVELGGPEAIRRAIALITDDVHLPLPDPSFDDESLAGLHLDGDLLRCPVGGATFPVATPPDGLRDLLGIARHDERLGETALLPRLREAKAQLTAYGNAVRALADEAAHVIAIRLGT